MKHSRLFTVVILATLVLALGCASDRTNAKTADTTRVKVDRVVVANPAIMRMDSLANSLRPTLLADRGIDRHILSKYQTTVDEDSILFVDFVNWWESPNGERQIRSRAVTQIYFNEINEMRIEEVEGISQLTICVEPGGESRRAEFSNETATWDSGHLFSADDPCYTTMRIDHTGYMFAKAKLATLKSQRRDFQESLSGYVNKVRSKAKQPPARTAIYTDEDE